MMGNYTNLMNFPADKSRRAGCLGPKKTSRLPQVFLKFETTGVGIEDKECHLVAEVSDRWDLLRHLGFSQQS